MLKKVGKKPGNQSNEGSIKETGSKINGTKITVGSHIGSQVEPEDKIGHGHRRFGSNRLNLSSKNE